jgi:hypothetical protein
VLQWATKGCHITKVVTPIGNDSHTLRFSKSWIARSWMPPKTGQIPRELLEPGLYSSGTTVQDSRALLRSCEWQAFTPRNSQIVFLSEFGETNTASRLTTDDIAMTFNISTDNVRQIRHRAWMKKKEPHRPLVFDPDQEVDIVRFIREWFGSQNYATQKDVLHYVEEQFNKTITEGWMKRFLDQHKSEVSGATVAPQEKVRLVVPRCYLEEYLTLAKKIVPIVALELLFNLDETELSESENRRSKPVLVRTQEQESLTLHYPVHRSVRHYTLLCCATASGDSYCPVLIAPTASARKLWYRCQRLHRSHYWSETISLSHSGAFSQLYYEGLLSSSGDQPTTTWLWESALYSLLW